MLIREVSAEPAPKIRPGQPPPLFKSASDSLISASHWRWASLEATSLFALHRITLCSSPSSELSLLTANDSLGVARDLRGQGEVNGRAAHADGEIFAFLNGGDPLLSFGIVEAPIRLAEHKDDIRRATAGDAQLVEATELPHHGLQAVKSHIPMWDCHTVVLADIGDLERDSSSCAIAFHLQVAELELCVRKPK